MIIKKDTHAIDQYIALHFFNQFINIAIIISLKNVLSCIIPQTLH